LQQYEDAIKLYKAGKSVDFDELPCPPGKLTLYWQVAIKCDVFLSVIWFQSHT